MPNFPNKVRDSVVREVKGDVGTSRAGLQSKEVGVQKVGVGRSAGMGSMPNKVVIGISSPMEELDSYFKMGLIATAKIGNPT